MRHLFSLYFSVHNCLAEIPFVRASLQSLTFEQEDYIAYLLDFVLLGHLLGQLMSIFSVTGGISS